MPEPPSRSTLPEATTLLEADFPAGCGGDLFFSFSFPPPPLLYISSKEGKTFLPLSIVFESPPPPPFLPLRGLFFYTVTLPSPPLVSGSVLAPLATPSSLSLSLSLSLYPSSPPLFIHSSVLGPREGAALKLHWKIWRTGEKSAIPISSIVCFAASSCLCFPRKGSKSGEEKLRLYLIRRRHALLPFLIWELWVQFLIISRSRNIALGYIHPYSYSRR